MKEEYHSTQFVTGPIEGDLPAEFYIVTAHNPNGQVAPDSQNTAQNKLLLAEIHASGWPHFPVTGQCEDHAEAGFGIACLREDALVLGRRFQQDAIYEVRDDQVLLVDCQESEADERVGAWSQLQAPLA